MCFNHHVAANVSDVTNVARIMLARRMLRLAGSQQASFASNTFSRFKSSSPWPSVASIKGCPFHAGRLPRLQSLQTPSYRAQAGMGFLYSNLTAPLLKKFATPVAGFGLRECEPSAMTTTRSIWGHGAPQKEFVKQGLQRRLGPVCMQRSKPDTVRGFASFSHFGISQLPAWGLIFANIAVYAMWEMEEHYWMIRNFMVSIDSVLSGRLHTLLTYSISHNRLDNLIEDMLGLYFFGAEIAHIYGGSYMLNIYLLGAIAGSIGHIAYCALLVPWLEGSRYDDFNYRNTPYALVRGLGAQFSFCGFGANGATNSLVVLHVLLFPSHLILANFVFPVPAIVFGAFLILSDVWRVYEEGARTTHAGHVVAALSGVVAWWRIQKGLRKPFR